ncbi:hypothetical protein PIB30_030305 [Stylosanthes scabra]|uniref:Aminotransferase-like plant mobile domain-containing protein n=1 Tax=Stylosanthes scabra TaxID=79078 RepID=A0ABU6RBR2_9FABA|nr:hypothetical protein [Stylosanthes scabra]
MPWLAPIPANLLLPAEVPVAKRWSRWRCSTRYMKKTAEAFRQEIDDMSPLDGFVWQPYQAVPLVDGLDAHVDLVRYIGPILSFECVEWHNVDRVMQQLGYWQPKPLRPVEVTKDHCKTLRGRQNHDWTDRANRLMEAEIPAYAAPQDDYMDWFRGIANQWLMLSGRVQGDAYMAEVPEEELAEVPSQPHEQQYPGFQPNFQPYEQQYPGFQPNFQPWPPWQPQTAQYGTTDDMQQLRLIENFLMRTTPPEQSRASTDCVPQVRLAPTHSSGSSWSSAGVIPNPPEISHHPVDLNTHQIPLDPADAVDEVQSDTRDEGPSGAGPGVEERYNLRDKDIRKAPKKYSPSPFQKLKNFTGFGKKK